MMIIVMLLLDLQAGRSSLSPFAQVFLSILSSLTLLVPLLPLVAFLGLSVIRTRTAWRYVYWDYVRH